MNRTYSSAVIRRKEHAVTASTTTRDEIDDLNPVFLEKLRLATDVLLRLGEDPGVIPNSLESESGFCATGSSAPSCRSPEPTRRTSKPDGWHVHMPMTIWMAHSSAASAGVDAAAAHFGRRGHDTRAMLANGRHAPVPSAGDGRAPGAMAQTWR